MVLLDQLTFPPFMELEKIFLSIHEPHFLIWYYDYWVCTKLQVTYLENLHILFAFMHAVFPCLCYPRFKC